MESHRLGQLIIRPQLLTFYAPYSRVQRRLLTLLNPSADKVLFKVRSNANRHYIVHPYCGCIDAYATSEIGIELNYFDFQFHRRYRHRFCIQWANLPTEDLPQGKETLSLFKDIPESEIYNVRIPIHLNEFDAPITPSEWNTLERMAMDERIELRALCPNCADPTKLNQAKRRRFRRKVFKILFIIGTIVGAYVLRHELYEFIKMQTEDEMEL